MEVEYNCPTCGVDFVVYHQKDERNTHCCWCGKEVKQTGKTAKIEGKEIIHCLNGQEVSREPTRR
jgi:DNA-directed RNA polymerase subunit RPC12/RpoP